MRNINASILGDLASEEFKPFLLLSMTVGGTDYNYTDCDVELTLSGDVFNPRGFKVTDVRYSLSDIVDEVTLEIDNLDSVITGLFVGGTAQGSDVILKSVLMDTDNSTLIGNTSFTIFEGNLDGWSLDESKATITITNQFHQWSQKTLSYHSPSCRWKEFKGTECAYAGAETWCDRTHARCVVLSNSTNFGGFRFIPSIQDKDIWWGRVSSVK